MFRKILPILCCLLIMITAAGCGNRDGDKTDTTGGEIAATTPALAENDSKSLDIFALGVSPRQVLSDNPSVADAALTARRDGIIISAYSDGTAKLGVSDYWGNTSYVEVTVSGNKITDCQTEKFSDPKTVNAVIDFGATGKGTVDDTSAIQRAINSLKDGGTLLIPAGVYSVSKLYLTEGLTVRLEGKVENPKDGYTEQLAARIGAGEFAVLKSDLTVSAVFANYGRDNVGENSASNITITGGVVDLNGSVDGDNKQIDTAAAGPGNGNGAITANGMAHFTCAENITVENVVVKDTYNGHVMQLCAVENVLVKDCVFAGYILRADSSQDVSTQKELIQIEHAHSGAIPPATFPAGYYKYSKNITVTGCYFGDSDKCGYPMTAIGQHGQHKYAGVDGLVISDNLFDNPYYCAIRFPGYVNVEITGNSFLSDRPGYTGGYFIDLFSVNGNTAYDGKNAAGAAVSVIYAYSYEKEGTKNVEISDNSFTLSGSSDKRVISVASSGLLPGAKSVNNVIRQAPGSYLGEVYSGFVKSDNYIANINIHDNTVALSCNPGYSNYFARFTGIYGFTYRNNTLTNTANLAFSAEWNGNKGVIVSPVSETAAKSLTVETSFTDYALLIPDGSGGTAKLFSDTAGTVRKVTLVGSEHIKLGISVDAGGNAVITAVCDPGYSLTGWSTAVTGTVQLTENLTLTAKEAG